MKHVLFSILVGFLLVGQNALAILYGQDVPEEERKYHVTVEWVSSYIERDFGDDGGFVNIDPGDGYGIGPGIPPGIGPNGAITSVVSDSSISPPEDKVCGGTIIADQWVLTSANCVNHVTNKKLVIRMNTYDYSDVETELTYFPDEVLMHPEFDNSSEQAMKESAYNGHNIALIKIFSKFPEANQAVLPDSGTPVFSLSTFDFYLAGFGYDYDNVDEEYIFDGNLKGRSSEAIFDSWCLQESGSGAIAMDMNMIFCSNSLACDGDIGGGAVYEGMFASTEFVMGVTSHILTENPVFGIDCFGNSYFTDVRQHVDWINTEMADTDNYATVGALCVNDPDCLRALDAISPWKTNSNVINYTYQANRNQRWKISEVAHNHYVMRSLANPRKCLTVDSGGWPAKGVNIRLGGLKPNGVNDCESESAVWILYRPNNEGDDPHDFFHFFINKATDRYLGLPCARTGVGGACISASAGFMHLPDNGVNVSQTGVQDAAFIYIRDDRSEIDEP